MAFDYDRLVAFDKVVISYNGSGDEGFIEDIVGDPREEGVILPDGVEIDRELYSDIEQEAYDLLEDHYAGWEINEGSTGEITLDVKARKAFIHHGYRVESVEYEDKEIA